MITSMIPSLTTTSPLKVTQSVYLLTLAKPGTGLFPSLSNILSHIIAFKVRLLTHLAIYYLLYKTGIYILAIPPPLGGGAIFVQIEKQGRI